MKVHCVQLMASTDVNVENVRNKVADLKTKYGEKLPKQEVPFDLGETFDSNISFYQESFRVTLTDKETEKNDLMEQIRKEMDKSASWWQLRYHVCDHGESDRQGCSWEFVEKSDSSTIPDEVEY